LRDAVSASLMGPERSNVPLYLADFQSIDFVRQYESDFQNASLSGIGTAVQPTVDLLLSLVFRQGDATSVPRKCPKGVPRISLPISRIHRVNAGAFLGAFFCHFWEE